MAPSAVAVTRPARLLMLALVVVAALASAATAIRFSRDASAGVSASNCDWRGQDLVRVKTFNCSLVCKLVLGCTHWTWNGDAGRVCYLKSGRRSLSAAFPVRGNVACGAMT